MIIIHKDKAELTTTTCTTFSPSGFNSNRSNPSCKPNNYMAFFTHRTLIPHQFLHIRRFPAKQQKTKSEFHNKANKSQLITTNMTNCLPFSCYILPLPYQILRVFLLLYHSIEPSPVRYRCY